MASNVQFSNFAAGTLTAPLSKTATSLSQVGATNSKPFPTVSNPTYFYATLIDQASYAAGISPPNQFEIIKVTTYAGSGAMTITRAQDGTTAQTWSVGDRIELRLTAQAIADATGASGAPSTTPYLTLAFDAGLSAERLFTPGTGMTGTDAGANSTYTLGMTPMAAAGVLGATAAGPVAQLTVAQVNTMLGTITTVGGVVSVSAGTFASRPAFGTAGRIYVATDTLAMYYDTGAAWSLIEPALTGDVTSAAGSLTTTIAAAAVTNAKMANMAANTVKGSIAGGTPVDLTQTQLTSLIQSFGSGTSGAVPASGGGTTNFLRADGTWAAPATSTPTLNTPYNVIINGGMIVNQRVATGSTITLTTTPTYVCDRWSTWLSTGTSSGSTMGTLSNSGVGRTSYAIGTVINGTGACVVSHRTRIESKDAIRLKNATASFACIVAQLSGLTQTVTVVIRKPSGGADNFAGGVTVIGTSAGTSVPSSTSGTVVSFNNVAMGDCSFGIEIEVQVPVGTNPSVVSEYITEAVLSEGTTTPTFPYISFEDEYVRCQRYYQKSFRYSTTPVQGAGKPAAVAVPATRAGAVANSFYLPHAVPMFIGTTPAPTITTYNPISANALAYDNSLLADAGAVTLSSPSERGFGGTTASVAGQASTAVGDLLLFHYTIDTDL